MHSQLRALLRPLSAWQLLALWENGLNQPPIQRALALLASAFPDVPMQTLAELPIGRRDAYLLSLRASVFGPRLSSIADCPACGERLEISFDVDEIRADRSQRWDSIETDEGEAQGQESLALGEGGYQVTFRLPNSLDLDQLNRKHPADQPQAAGLLETCLLSATYQGQPCQATQLPSAVLHAIEAKMAEADPQSEIKLDLTCPSCKQSWQASFDILSFFWAEIQAWAQRILREVHILASAYGWREADILALSPWRREMYLQANGIAL